MNFKKIILDYYYHSGRDFPWRAFDKIDAGLYPWAVVVSEFMLQQTQTARVVPYWERWMKKWPEPAALAKAPLSEVLREWSGLGYNRRAKNLRHCAGIISENHGGLVPQKPEELIRLPGIGAYTAGAIACFAFNYPAVFIETNIRAVFIHFFFPGKEREKIKDSQLLPLLEENLDKENPRRWYWALMDYGAELKKITANPARKSAHYVRQSPFKGSLRELRGAIVKNLAGGGRQKERALLEKLGNDLEGLKEEDFYRAVEALKKDMMVAEEEGEYMIRN